MIYYFSCSEFYTNLYTNAHSMGNKQELQNRCRFVVVLGSWRCGGIFCMTGGLQWRVTGSMGNTDKEDEEGELSFT